MNHKTARAFERLATLGVDGSAVDIGHLEIARTALAGADDISHPVLATGLLTEETLDVRLHLEQLAGIPGVPRRATPT